MYIYIYMYIFVGFSFVFTKRELTARLCRHTLIYRNIYIYRYSAYRESSRIKRTSSGGPEKVNRHHHHDHCHHQHFIVKTKDSLTNASPAIYILGHVFVVVVTQLYSANNFMYFEVNVWWWMWNWWDAFERRTTTPQECESVENDRKDTNNTLGASGWMCATSNTKTTMVTNGRN